MKIQFLSLPISTSPPLPRCSPVSPLPRRLRPSHHRPPRPQHPFNRCQHILVGTNKLIMIAIQKPPAFFAPSPAHMHRPNHSRYPSAPVVIRPSHTPGLLVLAKPAQEQPPKQQQAQQYQRAPRQSTRGKNQRSPQPASAQPSPVEDDKKPSPIKQRVATFTDKAAKSATTVASPEKSARGRQSSKQGSKDTTDSRQVLRLQRGCSSS